MARDEDFDEFAAAAWPRLRWSAYLLTSDHHLAEDLAQGALARTYARWSKVRHDDALAYSRRVLVNLNIDRLRRRRLREVPETHAPEGAAPDRPAEDLAARAEVLDLLATLTDKERRVVVLRHYFDLSEADVAAELGIAPGTVKSTLSRALGKLRVSATEEQSALSSKGQS